MQGIRRFCRLPLKKQSKFIPQFTPHPNGFHIFENPFRLVLTGGPCSGKTSIINALTMFLKEKGIAVVHVQESSTSLRTSGIEWSPIRSEDFQTAVVQNQILRENIAFNWCKRIQETNPERRTVIIFDRGLCDGLGFVDEVTFERCLKTADPNIDMNLFNRYDAVFHLETAAKVGFYENTSYRHETCDQAIEQDEKLQDIWKSHHCHHIFQNESDFAAKTVKVQNKISELFRL